MIKEFQGSYRWLSNFWMCIVEFDLNEYKSVEHAYQAAKFHPSQTVTIMIDEELVVKKIRELISSCERPGEAKRLGKKYKEYVNPQWHDELKLQVMEELVRKKFKHPNLKRLLLGTGNEHIQEGNYWGDEFWGVNLKTGKGENHLGKILMKIRKELQDQKTEFYRKINISLKIDSEM